MGEITGPATGTQPATSADRSSSPSSCSSPGFAAMLQRQAKRASAGQLLSFVPAQSL